jgi:hypothetical protein
MALNDLHPIAELRRRQAWLFENLPRADTPRRIVLYTMDPWQIGVFEQFLHLAFQRKGHLPKTLYYDGLLPITAWENHWVCPPNRETLRQRAQFMFDAFAIPAAGISTYLDEPVAKEQAERVIGGAEPDGWTGLAYRGIEIGRIALRDLFQYSMGCFEPCTPADVAEYRRHLVHAVMSVDLAYAIIERERPDIVVLVNGKSVMYSYLFEVARRLGVETTTWEEGMFFDASIVLAHNAKAIDFPIEAEIWAARRGVALTPQEDGAVDQYFERWRGQGATSHRYYDNEIRDIRRIRRELNLPPAGRIFSIFSNIVWDTNALDKDDAFDGILDWVFTTINVVGRLDNTTLIVRAHPGEYRCRFKTRTPVRAMIERQYGGVPSHVRIVDGTSELSSYEIARHSDCCAVYTSTLGIELALMGLQPLICGVPFYSRRGFTNDVISKAGYATFLGGGKLPEDSDPILLKRFLHLVILQLVKRPEFFVGSHGSPQVPKVALDSFEGFPESLPVFNEIVDCILDRRSFVSPIGRTAVEVAPAPAVGAVG